MSGETMPAPSARHPRGDRAHQSGPARGEPRRARRPARQTPAHPVAAALAPGGRDHAGRRPAAATARHAVGDGLRLVRGAGGDQRASHVHGGDRRQARALPAVPGRVTGRAAARAHPRLAELVPRDAQAGAAPGDPVAARRGPSGRVHGRRPVAAGVRAVAAKARAARGRRHARVVASVDARRAGLRALRRSRWRPRRRRHLAARPGASRVGRGGSPARRRRPPGRRPRHPDRRRARLPALDAALVRRGRRLRARADDAASRSRPRAVRLPRRAARLDRREVPRVERLRRRRLAMLPRRLPAHPGVPLLVHRDDLDLVPAVLRVRTGLDGEGAAGRRPDRCGRVPQGPHAAAAELGGAHLQRHPLHPDATRRALRRLRAAGAAGARPDRVLQGDEGDRVTSGPLDAEAGQANPASSDAPLTAGSRRSATAGSPSSSHCSPSTRGHRTAAICWSLPTPPSSRTSADGPGQIVLKRALQAGTLDRTAVKEPDMTGTGSPAARVLAGLDRTRPWQEDFYRHLHQHPELSHQEHDTAAQVADRLKGFGYQVHEGIGGTGVVGVLENGKGPAVLLRADMDALPVREETGLAYASTVTARDQDSAEVPVMHACGHDVHVTCLLGAAALLAGAPHDWQGRVVALFQPAEELGDGARTMLEDRLADVVGAVDVAFGQHVLPMPAGVVGTRPGSTLSAADSMRITVHGRGAHGSMPQASVDPVVLAAMIVIRLQTVVAREIAPTDPAVLTVGSIQAGTKSNVIGDHGVLQLNVRSYDDRTRNTVLEAVRRIVLGECQASGSPADPEFELFDRFPPTQNDPATTARVREAFEAFFGDRAHDLPLQTASEDFSDIPEALGVPYTYWGIGGIDPGSYRRAAEAGRVSQDIPVNHSPAFAPVLQPTLDTGTQAMVSAALAWLA